MEAKLKIFSRDAYRAIPFKKEAFSLLKQIYSPSQRLYQHFWFNGDFIVKGDGISFKMVNYNSVLETSLFWEGIDGYEKISLKLWTELCRNSSTILDIGANTGYFSLVAKAINPNSRVMAFEPVERIYRRLKLNCELNAFGIDVYNFAISDIDGTSILYDLPEEHHYHASLHKSEVAHLSQNLIEQNVITKRLDTFFLEQEICMVDLLKIDVEGLEPNVISGGKQIIQNCKPAIIVEIKNETHAAQIQELVNNFDYLYFDIDEEHGVRRIENLKKRSSLNVLLCDINSAKKLGL